MVGDIRGFVGLAVILVISPVSAVWSRLRVRAKVKEKERATIVASLVISLGSALSTTLVLGKEVRKEWCRKVSAKEVNQWEEVKV